MTRDLRCACEQLLAGTILSIIAITITGTIVTELPRVSRSMCLPVRWTLFLQALLLRR